MVAQSKPSLPAESRPVFIDKPVGAIRSSGRVTACLETILP